MGAAATTAEAGAAGGGDDGGLGKGLRWSLGLHVAFVLATLVQHLVFPSSPREAQLPVLKVDLVALPDQLKKDTALPSAAAPPDSAETEAGPPASDPDRADPDERVLKPRKSKAAEKAEKAAKEAKERAQRLKGALARAKALARVQSDVADRPPSAKAADAQPLKGNRLSGGSSIADNARESDRASYDDQIRDAISANWSLPPWLARQNLSAQVLIHVDSRGRIERHRFVKPSGNPQFDEHVRRAISESQPLPPPPPELVSTTRGDGIVVGFPL